MPIQFLLTPILGGLLTVGQAILVAGSFVYQRNQQRRLERQLADQRDAALGQDVRPTNASAPIGIHYGYGSTTGIRVFGSTDPDFTNHALPVTARGVSFGSIPNTTGTKNEFAIIQDVIGFDGMTEIVDFEIDEQDRTADQFQNSHRLNIYYDGGVADPLAFNNADGIANTAVFEDLSYATGVFRLNREDPQFSGFPTIRYYYRGKRVWDPREAGQSSSDPSTWTFSNNTSLVLLDYLTNADYGLGVPLAQIDLPGFRAAANVGDAVVQTGATVGGRVYGTTTTRDIRRHEFNGTLSSGVNHQQNIEEIVNTIPGGILIYTAEGRYKLVVPDSTRTRSAQSVRTLNTRDLTTEVNITYPSTRDKLNQATVSYANASQDFADDTITYPNNTTTALQNTLTDYLVEDNNTVLVTAVELPGIGSRYHAANFALSLVEQTRLKTYTFSVTSQHIDLEPGDVIQVQVPQQEFDDYVRIQSAQVDRRSGVINISAVEFDLADDLTTGTFVWKTEDNETITPREVFDFSVPAPVLAAPTITLGSGSLNQVQLSWTDGSSGEAAIVEYIVEYKLAADIAYTVAGTTVYPIESLLHSPVIDGLYDYRVRARTRDGRLSPTSNVQRVLYTVTPIAGELVYRFHENAVTMDPGAPTGMNGTGGGWMVSSDNPHWQAVTTSNPVGATREVTDFAVTGTAGTVTTQTADVMQQHSVAVSGVPGREMSFPAVPEVTTFTTTGNAANVTGLPALQEQWNIRTTGRSDGNTGTNEDFYIYLTGNSAASSGFTQYTGSTTVSANTPYAWRIDFGTNGLLFSNSTTFTTVAGSASFNNVVSTGDNISIASLVTAGLTEETLTASEFVTRFRARNSFPLTGGRDQLLDVAVDGNHVVFVGRRPASSVDFQVPSATTGGAQFRPFQLTPGQSLTLEFGTYAEPSTVRIDIPTASISATFTLTNGLTSATALRNDLLTQVQANTAITGAFTVTSEMGNVGMLTAVPYIRFTGLQQIDHATSATFNNGGGNLTGSELGTITEGATGDQSTSVRITYDSTLIPSFQDIALGAQATGNDIAGVMATMIDGHGELSATRLASPGSETRTLQPLFDNTLSPDFIGSLSVRSTWAQTTLPADVGLNIATGTVMFLYSGTRPTSPNEGRWALYEVTSVTGNVASVNVLSSRSTPSVSIDREVYYNRDVNDFVFADTFGLVQITVDTAGPITNAPTVAITQAGTTSSPPTFTVTTVQEGRADTSQGGVFTSFRVLQAGTAVGMGGSFESNVTGVAVLNTLRDYITTNLTGFSAAVANNQLTVTNPSASATDDVTITIIAGTNSTGTTGLNNLAVSRTLTTQGVAAFTAGTNASVEVFSGTMSLGTVAVGTSNNTQIANAVRALFNASSDWTVGPVSATDSFTLTSTFNGPTPVPSITTTPGATSDSNMVLTPGTLDVELTTTEDGRQVQTIGDLTQITITVGTSTDVVDLPSGANTATVRDTLINSINTVVGQYAAELSGTNVRATGMMAGALDNITMAVTRVGTNGTIAIVRTEVVDGMDGGEDLTNADWQYFVINQEVRVDDDTVTMDTNNDIMVRRGLINDVTTLIAETNIAQSGTLAGLTTPASATTTTTGTRASQFVVQGSISGYILNTSGGTTSSIDVVAEYSTDGGTTWTVGGDSFGLQVTNVATPSQFWATHQLSFTITATPSTTYMWRGRLRQSPTSANNVPSLTNHAGNIAMRLLILEELTA